VVLYELATGKRAFQRDSAAETMTAIIREDAAPLPAATPLPLQWTISRLLAKDPGDRYESTRDLYRELRQIRDRWSSITGATEHAATATPLVRSKARPTITLAAGVAAGALLAAAALTLWRSVPVTTPATPRRDLSAYRFTPVATDTVREQAPAWSPDGKSGALRLARPGEAPVEFAAPKEVAATVGRRLVGFSPDGSAVACIAGQHFPSIGE
jgi:hypothetical protein